MSKNMPKQLTEEEREIHKRAVCEIYIRALIDNNDEEELIKLGLIRDARETESK